MHAKSWLPFYFRLCALSIHRAQLSRSQEQASTPGDHEISCRSYVLCRHIRLWSFAVYVQLFLSLVTIEPAVRFLGRRREGWAIPVSRLRFFFNGSLHHYDVLFLYFLKVKPLAVFFTEKIFNDRFLRSF